MTLTRVIARPLLASTFVVGAVNALKNAEASAARAKPVTDRMVSLAKRTAPNAPLPTNPVTLVRLNAAAQLAGAAALATGRAPRLSALVLAGSLVPTTLAGHRFWEEPEPAARKQQRMAFVKNASVLGGLLLAGVDTEGRPGVAWRARRAAKDVRREAGHLAKEARREAKLARAQLT
jgi:putative oxidoreductase